MLDQKLQMHVACCRNLTLPQALYFWVLLPYEPDKVWQ